MRSMARRRGPPPPLRGPPPPHFVLGRKVYAIMSSVTFAISSAVLKTSAFAL